MPATAPAGEGLEFFGYVSFVPSGEDGEPGDFGAAADFTDETAALRTRTGRSTSTTR